MRRVFAAGLVGAMVGVAWGQQQVATPILPPLVRLQVVATDGSGNPSGDMTAGDLKITDQGKNQKIAVFRRPAQGGAKPHTTAILLDMLNEGQQNRLDAAKRIGQALTKVSNPESVYLLILTLEGNLHPIRAMQDEKGAPAAPDKDWVKGAEAKLDAAMKSLGYARPAGILQEDVVKKTYVALETLGNQLQAFPGHRDIVWVTDGVPTVTDSRVTCSGDWIECALYVPHLSVTLDKTGVAVNPLSYASGLNTATTRVMEEMAGLTGGRSFLGQDLEKVVDQIRAEAAASHLAVYDPGKENWDGKFHRVKVTSEKKGVRIAARNRYYGLPDVAQLPALEQAALTGQTRLAADAPEIGIRMKAQPVANNPQAVKLEIRINPADLLLLDRGDSVEGQVSVAFVHYGDGGPISMSPTSTFNLKLAKPQYEAALKDWLPFDQEHTFEPGAKKVRLMMYDRGARTIGSATIDLR